MSGDNIHPELLFLIARFLEQTPCTGATEALKKELDKYQLLPTRRTWQGKQLPSTFKDTVLLYKNVLPCSLPQLLQLALSQHNKNNKSHFQSPISLIASAQHLPANILRRSTNPRKPCHSLRTLTESNLYGSLNPRAVWPTSHYRTCTSLAKVFGHLAPVFCVAFDKRSEVVFTGSDDRLIKAWHLSSGRLLATFRGHHLEISDVAISPDNSLMASGSCDKTVRVWDMRTTENVAVLKGHTGTVTAVAFSPMYQFDGDSEIPPHHCCYLASGGADGVICLWRWRSHDRLFVDKPIKFIEKSRAGLRILSMSFSEGGYFLVAGSSDCVVRVYTLAVSFEKVAELECHSDEVDSLQFANNGLRFATAGCDGTSRIFHYERQQWRQLVIKCNQTLSKSDESSSSSVQVCMIRWNCNDEFLIASVSDKSVKVFDTHTGQLVRVLKGHKNQAFCISCSTFDPYLVVSGGYDGLIIVWDIRTGDQLFTYQNKVGEEHGAIHALSLNPDESISLAAADSYGNIFFFAFGPHRPFYSSMPDQMFFHTDYRALTHTPTDMPLDQLSGRPPHELPPPWMIDAEGAPYPSDVQQLVPGREKLIGQENVPELIVDDEGFHEVTDRSIADATAGRPAQNRPPAWGEARPLCRVFTQAEIANIISKASSLYDAECLYYEQESNRKLPKRNTDSPSSDSHRLRSWDQHSHNDSYGSSGDRYTIPATNRLCTRALYDTDSDGEEKPSRAGAASSESVILIDRSRRGGRVNYNEDDEDADYGSGSDREERRRTRQRPVIRDDEDDNTNDVPGTSSGRALRSSRRRRQDDDTSRSRGDMEFEDESRSRDMLSFDENSRGSSDMSVSEAVKRMASSASSSTRRTTRTSNHHRVVLNVESDDDSEEASSDQDSGDKSSSEENNSDDSDWRPSATGNGHSKHRSTRQHQQENNAISSSTRSTTKKTEQQSSSRREKKEERRSTRRAGKKSASPLPNSRYELRDHSKPSTSRQINDIPSTSGLTRIASTASSQSNGYNGASSSRRVKDEPVIPDDLPTERAKRYKKYRETKKQSPSFSASNDNEASSSIPDSETVDSNHRAQNGRAKTNGIVKDGDLERFQQIPPWMTQTSPTVRFPFVPQIGDEVAYIWRGHRLYVDAIQKDSVYPIKKGDLALLPYNVYSGKLLEEEMCRVEEMSVEMVPDSGVRLISIKLLVLRVIEDEEPITLSFKFHDLANVVDFMILHQWYERSLQREWGIGDKFRSQIDGKWYGGIIVGRQPAAPMCNFRIFRVLWDSEDDEDAVSPWDIEPLPKAIRNGLGDGASSPNDIAAYMPTEPEWPPSGDRETTCQRIVSCLDQVMSLSSAESFVVPVDYTAYPTYLCMIAYPVDLSLIRERLVSGYYRRVGAIKWDAEYISTNAANFNESESDIVRQSRTIVDILNSIIDDPDCVDASSKFPQRQRVSTRKRTRVTYNEEYDSSDVGESDHEGATISKRGGSYRQPPAKKANRTSTGSAASSSSVPHWKTLCQQVLSRLWKSPNSVPFQMPVDLEEYPDYARKVKNPIDLGTIRRRLQKGDYHRPAAFLKDVRLLFDNSRVYNVNDASTIYAMTTKLIDIFDGALSEFGQLLDDDTEDDEEIATSSRRTHSKKAKNRDNDDDSKRYRTRLTTGTIHYSNVQEADEALDMAIAEATSSNNRRSQSNNNNDNQAGRYHYRRLRTVGGGATNGGDSSTSLRRPATRHIS